MLRPDDPWFLDEDVHNSSRCSRRCRRSASTWSQRRPRKSSAFGRCSSGLTPWRTPGGTTRPAPVSRRCGRRDRGLRDALGAHPLIGPLDSPKLRPNPVDEEKLAAELADGVLTVRIPKLPKAQPRRIQIAVGSDTKQLKD